MASTIEQQGAINNATGNNLVCAIPGSGKTYTLIEMCKEILNTAPGNKICLLTFTNAGVNEMRARLQKSLTSQQFRRIRVATFHSLFLEQVKQSMNGTLLIGPSHYNFIERLRRKIKAEPSEDIMAMVEQVGMALDREKYDGTPLGDVYREYEKLKKANKKYDLNDAARHAVVGMMDNNIAPFDYPYYLVDEFQDTDEIQYKWLSEHNRLTGANITVVGDDDQSIYSFRGALGYDIMLRFQKELGAQLHIFSTCFRCRPEILSAAKNLIEFNEFRIPKDMKSNKEAGGHVQVYVHDTDKKQYETFVNDYKKNPGCWAVLCRNNSQLDVASLMLTSYEIPHRIANVKSIWDTHQADTVLKLLYCIRYPKQAHKYTAEILGYLHESEQTINEVVKLARKSNGLHNVFVDPNSNWNSLTEYFFNQYQSWIENEGSQKEIEARVYEIKNILSLAKSKDHNNAGKIDNIPIEAGVLNILTGYKGDWHTRLEKILRKLNNKKDKTEIDSDEVVLTTFHGSKGLEYQYLAIFDFIQGVSPSKHSKSLDALQGGEKGLSEERRLAFVAMTRAEEKLFIHSYRGKICPETGDIKRAEPSEFIEEILYEEC